MSRKIECAGKSTAFACEVLPESYELYDRQQMFQEFSSCSACKADVSAAIQYSKECSNAR